MMNNFCSLRNTILTCIMLIACMMLIACQPKCDVSFPPYPDDLTNIDKSLITGDPCEPPCWYGLLPGESTEEDVLDVISELRFVDTETINVQSWYGFPGWKLIEWNDPGFTSRAGRITIDADGNVFDIDLRPRYKVTLDELIDLYDDPDIVSAEYFAGCWDVWLTWFDIGLEVSFPASENQEVTPATIVYYVSLFTPASDIGEYSDLRDLTESELENIQEWEGFDSVKINGH